MSKIYQADQYYIPFRVEMDGAVVKPADVDGVRIALGGVVQVYPDGMLSFDGEENWMFGLSAEESQSMIGSVSCQVEIKKGANRQHSEVFYVDVKKSILKGVW